MVRDHMYDQFRVQVQPALLAKVGEFRLSGYETIKADDVWSFLTEKKWRRPKENIHLYEVVSDILSVKVGEYMNYAAVQSFKNADIFSLSEEEKRALFEGES